ncbi:MAG: ribosomal protein L13e [Candidatus Bathyarchaeota archaeon]|nr:ribosomal protein L13e [Candidatus Bathyarchaeota archaeon]
MHHIKPIITAQTGKKRPGRGFSPDEIKEAGLDAGSARKLSIPIDRKRKSSHEANVECLKAHMKNAPAKAVTGGSKKKSKN